MPTYTTYIKITYPNVLFIRFKNGREKKKKKKKKGRCIGICLLHYFSLVITFSIRCKRITLLRQTGHRMALYIQSTDVGRKQMPYSYKLVSNRPEIPVAHNQVTALWPKLFHLYMHHRVSRFNTYNTEYTVDDLDGSSTISISHIKRHMWLLHPHWRLRQSPNCVVADYAALALPGA